MVSIYEFKDGYYAVGEEGLRKWFIPDLKQAMRIYYKLGGNHIGLTSRARIRKIDKSLEEYFRSSV